jgi:hypothetical protein
MTRSGSATGTAMTLSASAEKHRILFNCMPASCGLLETKREA